MSTSVLLFHHIIDPVAKQKLILSGRSVPLFILKAGAQHGESCLYCCFYPCIQSSRNTAVSTHIAKLIRVSVVMLTFGDLVHT